MRDLTTEETELYNAKLDASCAYRVCPSPELCLEGLGTSVFHDGRLHDFVRCGPCATALWLQLAETLNGMFKHD